MSSSVTRKIIIAAVLFAGVIAAAWLFLSDHNIAVLNPKGYIANEERDLMLIAALLSIVVIVPVFILTFFIAWRYRESNRRAKHTPDWDHNVLLESIWWAIPCAIILVLAVITWQSSHALDPFKPLDSSKKPVNIQVVALQWKWLFIYPKQGIATVNYMQIPEKTPVNLTITADAPMNSLWIPQLGGQVYAMAGMSTKLHLMANGTGSYRGVSANISGAGFSGMKFVAKSTSKADFEQWVGDVQKSSKHLMMTDYDKLAQPSKNNPVAQYAHVKDGLYNAITMKYMHGHGGNAPSTYTGHEQRDQE